MRFSSPALISKVPSLSSNILPSNTSDIIIKQSDEILSGTVHVYEPAAASTPDTISVHDDDPLSVENAIFIFVMPELVHVMFWVEPAIRVSPPLGEVRVRTF